MPLMKLNRKLNMKFNFAANDLKQIIIRLAHSHFFSLQIFVDYFLKKLFYPITCQGRCFVI